ncbi:related to UDP-galactose transporter [Sporisorium reilianum SRZ2]|uniref:Related to UDP-galactose transporter n=1 Tax=Sporisorium reilianum (strain SRZ2) TaxID=999809 RepID=E6ZVQ2_SPORE|nr:related to UDP-galactose transporter [Sporisorium reilianum SRZ2]
MVSTAFGLPLKHVSLAVLTIQNTALGVVMHHSRVSAPVGKAYFFPTAVLLTELLKCLISFVIAVISIPTSNDSLPLPSGSHKTPASKRRHSKTEHDSLQPQTLSPASHRCHDASSDSTRSKLKLVLDEVAAEDYWKLSIPAILYVLQNNLQYVAVSNLEPPVFICAYQMKILTTAFFSIVLLRKKIGMWQWLSLGMLAIGVAVVQIQSKSVSGLVPFEVHSHGYGHVSAGPVADLPPPPPPPPFDSHRSPPPDRLPSIGSFLSGPDAKDYDHLPPSSPSFPGARISMSMEESAKADTPMQPIQGFLAVIAACFTSGLAGVYFEMVLKTSDANLWARNVQLSAWSLIPAALPVLLEMARHGSASPFLHFGLSAWATVVLQVTGGLAVAMVIKHADNILKGFAVSFSIVLSFGFSVAFFNFPFTAAFAGGVGLVVLSTLSYARGPMKSLTKAPSSWTAVADAVSTSASSSFRDKTRLLRD